MSLGWSGTRISSAGGGVFGGKISSRLYLTNHLREQRPDSLPQTAWEEQEQVLLFRRDTLQGVVHQEGGLEEKPQILIWEL